MASARLLLGALLVSGSLVGCGGGSDSAPPATSPAPSPAPTPATSASPPAAPPAPSATALACAGRDVEVLPTAAREVALTVDLGSGAQGLPSILRTLADQDVSGTFFVTGDWVRRNHLALQQIAAAGHRIGNHTEDHPALTGLAEDAIRAQLTATEQAVREAVGRSTKPLFRFPFGDRDARTLRVVNRAGYCAYRWTVDTLGWKGTSGGVTPAVVVERVLESAQPGQIVLMHGGAHPDDGSTLDADALPELVRRLQEHGYGFTTLPGGP